jgi:cell division protein FtsB
MDSPQITAAAARELQDTVLWEADALLRQLKETCDVAVTSRSTQALMRLKQQVLAARTAASAGDASVDEPTANSSEDATDSVSLAHLRTHSELLKFATASVTRCNAVIERATRSEGSLEASLHVLRQAVRDAVTLRALSREDELRGTVDAEIAASLAHEKRMLEERISSLREAKDAVASNPEAASAEEMLNGIDDCQDRISSIQLMKQQRMEALQQEFEAGLFRIERDAHSLRASIRASAAARGRHAQLERAAWQAQYDAVAASLGTPGLLAQVSAVDTACRRAEALP